LTGVSYRDRSLQALSISAAISTTADMSDSVQRDDENLCKTQRRPTHIQHCAVKTLMTPTGA